MTTTDYNKTQVLTGWEGDVSSLIAEMKRRAGVATDTELGEFIGISQGAIANWRRREAVPEAALQRFQQALDKSGGASSERAVWARCVTMRLAEFWYSKIAAKNPEAPRTVPYLTLGVAFPMVVAEVAQTMERLEKDHSITTREVASLMLDEGYFLEDLTKWIANLSFAEIWAASRDSVDAVGRGPYQ